MKIYANETSVLPLADDLVRPRRGRGLLARMFRPRAPITPDPKAAAALARKYAQLAYTPETPFHRDRVQPKQRRTGALESWPMLLRRQAG
jgi:hypothetical protein